MYTRCIYCSGPLGRNETVEEFPVGRTVAFDGARGRLWAVCVRCGRWNLAPIEERWEAVEALEKRFHYTRLKVQSENIGLSRAADGTRLVRVGQALPGELAAWRYGTCFAGRRRRYLVSSAVGTTVMTAFWAMTGFGISGLVPVLLPAAGAVHLLRRRQADRAVALVRPVDGGEVLVRTRNLRGARLREPVTSGERLALVVKVAAPMHRLRFYPEQPYRDVLLAEPDALRVLRRGMVHVNAAGATPRLLNAALDRLQRTPLDEYVRGVAGLRKPLGRAVEHGGHSPDVLLGLEMALHEEDERRAMEGELASLEAAWREAEEIAAIADALPNVPPPEAPRLTG
jgi:hypothetical protein